MKHGSPDLCCLIVPDQAAPSLQTVLRYPQRLRMGVNGQSAPYQRLYMHCAACTNGSALHLSVHRNGPFPSRFTSLLGGQFALDFQGFYVGNDFQPTRERRVGEPVFATVATLRQTAPLPCFDVNSPPLKSRSVLETYRCHRRSSNARRNPICTSIARQKNGARTGRLHTILGGQD